MDAGWSDACALEKTGVREGITRDHWGIETLVRVLRYSDVILSEEKDTGARPADCLPTKWLMQSAQGA